MIINLSLPSKICLIYNTQQSLGRIGSYFNKDEVINQPSRYVGPTLLKDEDDGKWIIHTKGTRPVLERSVCYYNQYEQKERFSIYFFRDWSLGIQERI